MARILHIEDDARNRLLVRKLLQSAGHEVVEAEGGLEAIRLAQDMSPDLVLVDINIPDLDGYEVTLRLRAMTALAQVPIVAITAEGERDTSLAVGADGFLSKPIDASTFARTVARFLRGHREKGGKASDSRLRERSQIIVQRLEQKVQALSMANRRLEEMARLRREFLQNVSHELATPLTPALGYLRLLLKGDLGELTHLQRKSLVAVERSTERLRGLIDTLLDVSALESGRMQFYGRDYDLCRIVRAALDRVASRLQECKLELHVHPSLRDAAPAWGDADKLKRAIGHVLDNAVKFSPTGGRVSVGIERRGAQTPGLSYGVWVADEGPGIAAAQQEKIFQPFYQVDGSATRSHGGVGLGLAFARSVCQALGGTVTVHSPPPARLGLDCPKGTAVFLEVAASPPRPKSPPKS
ncbi:MAG: response regulator [Polyangiales bacterium]